jgi:protein gp37
VKFVSFEPLLESIASEFDFGLDMAFKAYGINWVIIGQQTPHNKLTEPNISWIAQIIESADKAKVPVFLKNNLKDLLPPIAPFVTNPLRDTTFGLWQEFPKSEVK